MNTPQSPPGPKPSFQRKPSSPPCRTQDGGDNATAAGDSIDAEMTRTAVGDVSNAGSTEGEAELPAIDDDNNSTKSEPPSKDPKGKCREEVVAADNDAIDKSSNDTPSVGSLPPRPVPLRPGWGRHPDEKIFHIVPPSHGGPYKKRAVFRVWPRGPNGTEVLTPHEMPGARCRPMVNTLPKNHYAMKTWEAMKLDVAGPEFEWVMTIMTGSAIWEAMKELGELDVAGPEIEWAKSEGKPRMEGVANTEVLIQWMENKLQLRAYHHFSILDDVRRTALPFGIDREDAVGGASEDGIREQGGEHDEEHNKEDVVEQAPEGDSGDGGDSNDEDHDEEDEGDEVEDESDIEYDDDMEVDPASIPPSPTIPVTSPFHPSHYPKPWPFIPFSNPLSVPLQERIPLYLLPQTLYVHDPFSLLPARERTFRDTSWMSRPDIIRTYDLRLSGSVRKEVEEARQKAEELEEFDARTLIILRYKRTKEQIKNHEPAIEVPLPPHPRRMTKVEESHLYLSPVARVGKGHHSIVYKGEWELPRDIFTRRKICQQCFKESADKEIQRLKDTGRWEKMLRAASWGATGFTGRRPMQAELDEVRDPIHPDRDGEIIEREITYVVTPDASPSHIYEVINEGNILDVLMKLRNELNALHLNLTGDGDEGESTKGSDVATIRINPPFSYESQKTCTHGSRRFAIPRTAKFTVAAKLSIENDHHHLVREASNYQQFPEHFFHHYNGYTLIDQLHTIVPINAVVPQFYGFYTPKKDKTESQGQEPYLSPILLLEHCGEPIEPEKLSVEDQEECTSLLLRFQRARWLHESVARRNFLVQFRKPTVFPVERQHEPSFRLIDFGRSRKLEQVEEKQAEERDALRMFEKLYGRMSITSSM